MKTVFVPFLLSMQERALKENNDWESFAELLGYIFHVRRAVADRLHFQALPKSHTDQSSGGKRSAAGLTNAENIKNSNLVKRVADSVIWRDGCEGSNALMPKCDGHCSLLTLTEPLFLSIMETFLAECIAVDSTLSLRAASIIVSDFTGYCSLNEVTFYFMVYFVPLIYFPAGADKNASNKSKAEAICNQR